MEVDVRTSSGVVVAIRYSDAAKLVGSDSNPNIRAENNTGQGAVICSKEEIPTLIKALQLAQKTWNVKG